MTIALRDEGPGIVPETLRRLNFGGEPGTRVADFDAALRDPDIPTKMLPVYDCGDGLHPSYNGYCRMGEVIDLSLFDSREQ